MNIAIITAGGTGQRMHSKTLPKQFLIVHGRPIIVHTVSKFQDSPLIDGIIVVCLEQYIPDMKAILGEHHLTKVSAVVPGGETGQLSIYNGLIKAKEIYGEDGNVVLIHDGVRPLINEDVIEENIDCVNRYGGAVTISYIGETVLKQDEQQDVAVVFQKNECYLGRAPQSFRLKDILLAHKKAKDEGMASFIDSVSLMKHFGFDAHCVIGPSENIKITNPMDFFLFKAILDSKEDEQINVL